STGQKTDVIPGSGTFRKLMEVLRCVADAEGGATFPQLLRVVTVPKSTLHRLLQVLINEGMVRLDPDRCYRLGFAFFELARLSWDRLDIRKEAQSQIHDLVCDVGETVHLAILDGVDVVYVDKLEGPHTIRMASM